ncbi:MAG: DUF4330 domain-containing protein [Gudongella sp.]|jgi:hypothetical protein|nr:DUF4330 domain-containing protein [Gudongella sp.]
MKLISKDGKVFNKINILDLLFVAILLFLVFLSAIKMMGKDFDDISMNSEIRNIEIKFLVEGEKGYLDSIKPGDRLGETKQYLNAYVDSVYIEEVEAVNADSMGNAVISTDPLIERAVVIVTATLPYENLSYKLGKQEIRQGKIIFLESDFYRYHAQIESVKVVD